MRNVCPPPQRRQTTTIEGRGPHPHQPRSPCSAQGPARGSAPPPAVARRGFDPAPVPSKRLTRIERDSPPNPGRKGRGLRRPTHRGGSRATKDAAATSPRRFAGGSAAGSPATPKAREAARPKERLLSRGTERDRRRLTACGAQRSPARRTVTVWPRRSWRLGAPAPRAWSATPTRPNLRGARITASRGDPEPHGAATGRFKSRSVRHRAYFAWNTSRKHPKARRSRATGPGPQKVLRRAFARRAPGSRSRRGSGDPIVSAQFRRRQFNGGSTRVQRKLRAAGLGGPFATIPYRLGLCYDWPCLPFCVSAACGS